MSFGSKYLAIRTAQIERAFPKRLQMYVSDAVAIAIGQRVSDIGVVEPSFKTVEARSRAAQGAPLVPLTGTYGSHTLTIHMNASHRRD